MNQHPNAPAARPAPMTLAADGRLPAWPVGDAAARGETRLWNGTLARMPIRARLALVQPRMLKAQVGRAGRS